ncbi:6044_t:CDS:2, partial [Cetraspora pellucida]
KENSHISEIYEEDENYHSNNDYINCRQDLVYHQSTTAMKTHLATFHHITKTTVKKNQGSSTSQQLLLNILSNISKIFHSIKKQKELNQYLVKFIVRTVQSLQLVEASDFINFL